MLCSKSLKTVEKMESEAALKAPNGRPSFHEKGLNNFKHKNSAKMVPNFSKKKFHTLILKSSVQLRGFCEKISVSQYYYCIKIKFVRLWKVFLWLRFA